VESFESTGNSSFRRTTVRGRYGTKFFSSRISVDSSIYYHYSLRHSLRQSLFPKAIIIPTYSLRLEESLEIISNA
jgi:hypothetical protein